MNTKARVFLGVLCCVTILFEQVLYSAVLNYRNTAYDYTEYFKPPKKKNVLWFRKIKRKRCTPCYKPAIDTFFKDIFKDALLLQLNLIDWDTFKVIATVFPFYIASRIADDKLHRCFYDESSHKNRTQLPRWCHDVAQFSLGIPIIILGSQAFFSGDYELQQTARMLLIGIPFVIFAKDLIKKFDFEACLRPWNEHFSCKKRAQGGFPSGHMAEATYVAVLYGMRFGPSYAIPLGLLAALIGVCFLNCNRHYMSQLIAGVGFGSIYALSAQKIIDKKLADRLELSMSVHNSNPTLTLSYRF